MPQNLKTLRRRIRSVSSTQKVTRAMETVSAAKLRRSQERLAAAEPHATVLRKLVRHLAESDLAQQHPFFQVRPVERRMLIVVTADRGLCGAFNSNLLRRADQWLETNGGPSVPLICIGKKGRDYYRRRQRNILHEEVSLSGVPSVEAVRAVVSLACRRFLDGDANEVWLAFTRYRSVITFQPVVEKFLPLDTVSLETEKSKADEGHTHYIYEPDPGTVLAALLPRFVEARLYLALAESFTSEHSARRVAMNTATTNCAELLDLLTLQRNKARQAAITTELLDIVGGAEALTG